MSGTKSDPQLGGVYIGGPRQWLRKCSLLVSRPDGQALDLSQLRVTFKILQAEIQTPNVAWIRVYNPAPDTVRRIGPQREFTRVILQAGYEEGNFGIIFDGQIKQAKHGRDNAIDTYLEIAAADGDTAYNSAVVSLTLAAGSTTRDIINQAARAMAPYNVTLGPLPDNLPNTRLPRAITLHAMARDVMRAAAAWAGCNWSIVNGQITFTPVGGYVEGEAVVLTAYTGMVGMPEQTQDGIMVRCLLNPRIFPGRRIKLDNDSIQQARLNLSYTGELQNEQLPPLQNDGFYRVVAVDWVGDTRGQEWYNELTCLSIDPTAMVPISQASRRPYDISTSGL